MANHIRFKVSVELIDEHTQTVAWEGDDDNSRGADVVTTEYIRHHDIPTSIGGSVTAIDNDSGGIEIANDTLVMGYADGVPSYTLLDKVGTKTSAGILTDTQFRGIFIKHTGYTDSNKDTRSYEQVAVWVEYDTGEFAQICSIPSGGCIFLPQTRALGSGLGFKISASDDYEGSTSDDTILAQVTTMKTA